MELMMLRARMDAIDRELFALLEKRMDVSADMATYKKAHDVPIFDEAREEQMKANILFMIRPETKDLLMKLYDLILDASREYQQRKMEEDGK